MAWSERKPCFQTLSIGTGRFSLHLAALRPRKVPNLAYLAFSIAARLGAGWQQLGVPPGGEAWADSGCRSAAHEAMTMSALAPMKISSRFTSCA